MAYTFISSLFVNICILISMIFLAGSATMARRYKPFAPDAGLLSQILAGVVIGGIGVLLMAYSVKIPPVIVDLRYIPVILAALIGRLPTALVAAVIVTFFRLTLYPVTESSLWACAGLFIMILFTFLIRRTTLTMIQKALLANLFGALYISVHFYMFVLNHTLYWTVIMPGFWIASWTALLTSGMLILFLRRVGASFAVLEETANIDFLTGLNNARSFDKAINAAVAKATEQRKPLALLLIDIDFFKRTNDTYGHPAGDAVLAQLGQVLAESCRAVDIISRNGGEEFSVILPGCDHSLTSQIAERIRRTVQERPFILPDGTRINITVSIGVSQLQGTGHSTEQLIKQADDALYQAKHSGRNQVQFAV
ncbi:diguanylate cyclase [Tumebacillus sp. BK434]|uniref:diguanylate cyclase n=1 Tax=Tumebacillus sp. BK434 TaxID=2512169 RepID=UPI0010E0E144|nr:diguanylate cyclase [Tumebacillus sp. BK434]TCP58186.1 diguanylate cyclase [Tumebacillus sp. BK434]